MVPIFATSTQTNLLIYVGGGGFVLLGAFYFGRLVTFFFFKQSINQKREERERGTYSKAKRICRVPREGLKSIKGE